MFDALTWVHIYVMITVSDRYVFTTFLWIHSFLQSFSHVCIHQKRSFLALPLSLSCTCIMHPVMDLQRTWSCNGHINPSWAKFALFSKPHEYIQNTALHIWYGPWNIFNATLWVLMLFYTLNQNFNSCQKSKLWWFLNFHTIFGVKIQISKTCNITEQL